MTAPAQQDRPPLAAITAAAVMTSPVVCVGATTPLSEVWQLMLRHGVPRVVVSEGEVPLGIVDQLDVLTAWGSARTTPPEVLAVVTATPCLSPDSPLAEICSALLQSHHEAAMVLDRDGHLRGVVSLDSVLPALSASGSAC